MSKPVILTGIRSNEEPTLGNYLGAFAPMVRMQKEFAGAYQINMFVPDLHSFTTPVDHSNLYENTLHNLKYFIASGLNIDDPDTFIYRQSYIPAHSELTWILDCFTYMGEMSRMTQFKDKSGIQDLKTKIKDAIENVKKENGIEIIKNEEYLLSLQIDKFTKESLFNFMYGILTGLMDDSKRSDSSTVGLFNYPVLMAVDILLYGAKHVPVGEDQFQHLEITRDIAMRFNNKFGEIFVVPDATKDQMNFIKRDAGLKIRSLTDPTKKMSKSSDDPKSKILLNDTPEAAASKIMGATTDSKGVVDFDWNNQPGITSLLQILALLTGKDQNEVNDKWRGETSYGDFKQAVAEVVKVFLTDFQAKYAEISDEQLIAKLEQSERDLTPIADATLLRAQQAVGLRPKAN